MRQHELNGYATILMCDEPDRSLFSQGPYVGQTEISNYGEGLDALDTAGKASLRYDIYVPERSRYHSEADANAPMPSYNLGGQSLELCVRIAGGAMHGAYNRSNQVRVRVGRTR